MLPETATSEPTTVPAPAPGEPPQGGSRAPTAGAVRRVGLRGPPGASLPFGGVQRAEARRAAAQAADDAELHLEVADFLAEQYTVPPPSLLLPLPMSLLYTSLVDNS